MDAGSPGAVFSVDSLRSGEPGRFMRTEQARSTIHNERALAWHESGDDRQLCLVLQRAVLAERRVCAEVVASVLQLA